MRQLKIIWLVFVKDLKLEFRNPAILLSSVTIAVLVVIIFGIALNTTSPDSLAAIIWVGITFAATTGFTRSLHIEQENGVLNGLRTTPVGGELIVLGKVLSNFIFINIVTLCIFLISIILLSSDYLHPVTVLVHLSANLGLSMIGTIFAAITVRFQAREVLLALLIIPAVFPLLFAAISSAQIVLAGRPMSELWNWLLLIALFDIVAIAAVVFLARPVIEE